jgi:hypothetical protein
MKAFFDSPAVDLVDRQLESLRVVGRLLGMRVGRPIKPYPTQRQSPRDDW